MIFTNKLTVTLLQKEDHKLQFVKAVKNLSGLGLEILSDFDKNELEKIYNKLILKIKSNDNNI